MLHDKFRGNGLTGPGEVDFRRGFTIYGHGGHLGHVTKISRTKFQCHYPWRLHIKLQLDRKGVSEKKIFEIVDDDDGRRTDAGSWVYYKLTCEPSAQVS